MPFSFCSMIWKLKRRLLLWLFLPRAPETRLTPPASSWKQYRTRLCRGTSLLTCAMDYWVWTVFAFCLFSVIIGFNVGIWMNSSKPWYIVVKILFLVFYLHLKVLYISVMSCVLWMPPLTSSHSNSSGAPGVAFLTMAAHHIQLGNIFRTPPHNLVKNKTKQNNPWRNNSECCFIEVFCCCLFVLRKKKTRKQKTSSQVDIMSLRTTALGWLLILATRRISRGTFSLNSVTWAYLQWFLIVWRWGPGTNGFKNS